LSNNLRIYKNISKIAVLRDDLKAENQPAEIFLRQCTVTSQAWIRVSYQNVTFPGNGARIQMRI